METIERASRSAPAAAEPAPQPSESAKRRQILEGAREVFKTMGFDAASMNDITRAAGVSKGTVYVYFRSKEELFTALIEDVRARHKEELRQKLLESPDIETALTRFGCALAVMVSQDWALKAYRIVVGVAERMPELGRTFFEDGPGRGVTLLASYLEAQVAAGTLEIPDTRLAAWQLLELVQAGIARPRLFCVVEASPTEAEIEHVVASGVTMFLGAYRPKR